MALDNNVRLAVQAKLKLGISPKDVAEQLNVKLPTVYTIKQKLDKDKENGLVDELHATPQDAIAAVVEKARDEILLPTPQGKNAVASDFVDKMEAVAVGAGGLKKLDMSFQTTMTNVLGRFDELLKDKEMPLKDIIQISSSVSNAYEKVFNAGTNIHIGDNNSNSSQNLTIFKSKQGI